MKSQGVSSAAEVYRHGEGGRMLFVGDDWARDHHNVELVDEDGKKLAAKRLPEEVTQQDLWGRARPAASVWLGS